MDGAVSFTALGPNLTRVLLVLEYWPQGFFERTGNLWRAQSRRARLEFKHFRRHAMTNVLLRQEEVEGWRGEIRDSEVVKTHEEALEEEQAQQEQPVSTEDEAAQEETTEEAGPEEATEETAEDETTPADDEVAEDDEGAVYDEEEPDEAEDEYADQGEEYTDEYDEYDEGDEGDEGDESVGEPAPARSGRRG